MSILRDAPGLLLPQAAFTGLRTDRWNMLISHRSMRMLFIPSAEGKARFGLAGSAEALPFSGMSEAPSLPRPIPRQMGWLRTASIPSIVAVTVPYGQGQSAEGSQGSEMAYSPTTR